MSGIDALGTLREQVMQAFWDDDTALEAMGNLTRGRVADLAIGVVLGVVADEIKALRRSTPVVGWPGLSMHKSGGGSWIHVDDVLAVVERLRG